MREAWSIIEGLWEGTVVRARRLPEAALHERVDEEWSFLETLRHLVFVIDAWISRTVLGATDHYHPLGLPYTDLVDLATPAELARTCAANPSPGYPEQTTHGVTFCLHNTIDEEWSHHQFATRDLAVLEARSS